MKNILSSIILCAAILIGSLSAQGQNFAKSFSGTGTGSTVAYYIAPIGDGSPQFRYINVTSDKTNAVLTFYSLNAPILLAANIATNALVVASTDTTGGTFSFASNDVAVIYHVTANSYERVVLNTNYSTTNITLSANSATAITAGDMIFKAVSASTIPAINLTKELASAAPIFTTPLVKTTQQFSPGLVDLNGTSAVTINAVSGNYVK